MIEMPVRQPQPDQIPPAPRHLFEYAFVGVIRRIKEHRDFRDFVGDDETIGRGDSAAAAENLHLRYDTRVKVSRLVVLLVLLLAPMAFAHPMGNFSVNHYAGLSIDGAGLRIFYRIDYAEIPSVHEIELLDTDGNQQISDAERDAYLAKKSEELTAGLKLRVDGKPIALSETGRELQKRPGAADLPTLLVSLHYHVSLSAGHHTIEFIDDNLPDRLGWREITASGNALVKSDVPARSKTNGLENYPELTTVRRSISGMRQLLSTSVRTQSLPRSAKHQRQIPGECADGCVCEAILSKDISAGIVVVSLLLAMLSGWSTDSRRDMETIVAAYLVGSRGTPWHAMPRHHRRSPTSRRFSRLALSCSSRRNT